MIEPSGRPSRLGGSGGSSGGPIGGPGESFAEHVGSLERRTKPVPTAYNRALDALSRRARSTTELSRWLRQRDYEPEEISDVLERLTAAGLLDDTRYAELFARSRLLDRKLSTRRVLAELGRRGISRPMAAAAVQVVTEDEGVDEDAAAEAVARKKFRTMGSLAPDVARRRLFGFLARRGYDADVVRRVIAKL